MKYTDKKREKARYDVDYAKKNIKRVPLDMQKDDYDKLQAAASAAGEKVNTYIKRAIFERMEREQAHPAAQPEDAQQNSRPSTLDTMRAIAASGRSVADIIREERAAAAAKAETDREETHRGDIPISFPDSDDDIDKVDLPF